jgi:class 3 adenylate cyclase/tetratricopeptide (TPR) repeat protein
MVDVVRPSLSGQRRHLTVLFADLSGSTRMGEQMEAEDFAELLGRFRALCQAVIPRHGGLIARTQSDGVLALFGDQGAREDDGRRAVEAALELSAAMHELRSSNLPPWLTRLDIHSGVHAGHCFVDQGDLERGRLDVVGDVPNIAAGLASLARPGEVCVSTETLGPAAHFFRLRDQRIVQVKSRQQPLAVCTVVGHADARTRFEAGAARGLSPFVGRAQELAVLQARLRSALNGSPHTLVIVGNPGVGKTRLIDELARDATREHCLVLRGFCESYLSAAPLQPFVQIVQAATEGAEAATAEGPAATARRLLQPAAAALGPGAASHADRLTATLRDAFDALAAEVPLLLAIDDWQWADDGSVQVLDSIRTLARPIFILLATRESGPEDLAVIRADRLRLEPLSKDAVAASVRHLVPSADPFLVDDIYRDSGGNPLFIEELCHSAQHLAVREPERGYGGSAWLASLIEARVSRLPPDDARVVRAASVIGNVVGLELLSRVVGFEVDEARLKSLASHDFLYPAEQAGSVRFKHGITREVAYAGVGLRERVAIHQAVAKAMEAAGGAEQPEALAYHYARGQLPLQAAHHAERAGDKAMAAHALDRARLQYVAALEALDQVFVPDRAFLVHWCEVAQRLGMASVFDALAVTDTPRLMARGVELARQAGDPPSIARAEYWLAYILYAKGRGREALRHSSAALEVAQGLGDARLDAQLLATHAQIHASLAHYDEALPLLDAAIDSKRARGRTGSGVAVGSVFSLAIKGSALADQGRFDLAEECFQEMLHLLRGSTHQIVSSVRNWIGMVYLWQGRWADAVAAVEDSIHIAQSVRSHLLLSFGKAVWGYGQWRLAGTVDASQAVHDATRWVETRGNALGASLHYGWLLDIGEGRGSDPLRRRHAALLLQRAREHDELGVAMGCRALARAAAKAGDPLATQRYFQRAERAAERRRSAHERAVNQLCLAEIRLLQGRPREALAPLDAAGEGFTTLAMDWHLHQVERLRVRIAAGATATAGTATPGATGTSPSAGTSGPGATTDGSSGPR